MSGHSDCLGVLRQLVRMLSQSDDSCEKKSGSLRKQCERKDFGGEIPCSTTWKRVWGLEYELVISKLKHSDYIMYILSVKCNDRYSMSL